MGLDARLLSRALADPSTVLALDADGWTALLTMARAEQLLASLAWRVDGLAVPARVQAILDDARAAAESGRAAALWEAEMARRALAELRAPVVLLKGTAFVAAGLAAGRGRMIGDLDLLVSRRTLAAAEAALLRAGWEWVKEDAYDDGYYRRWMHELPPLIHRTRDRMVDVHHTILPPTARPKPLIDVMIADAELLSNGLAVLAPEHMVIHAAAHLFADGDLSGGLRNLWDIDRLCREFAEERSDFYLSLIEEAWMHRLGPHVMRALRLSHQLFGTPVVTYRQPIRLTLEPQGSDRWYIRRLLARDGWGRATRPATRFAFYVRSHWQRMPPAMLARHLWTKWRRSAR